MRNKSSTKFLAAVSLSAVFYANIAQASGCYIGNGTHSLGYCGNCTYNSDGPFAGWHGDCPNMNNCSPPGGDWSKPGYYLCKHRSGQGAGGQGMPHTVTINTTNSKGKVLSSVKVPVKYETEAPVIPATTTHYVIAD